MNAVVFYSNTGHSASLAKYMAEKLNYPVFEIEKVNAEQYENLVLIFPVHCQNIPYVVQGFLKTAKVQHLIVVATYGKMCCGNVLYEVQNKFHMNVVAGAYIPCGHAYLDNDAAFCDFEQLAPLLEKIENPSRIDIPKLYKNPFANLFPSLRSRLGLKLYKNANCDSCDICAKHCSFKAIKSGVTNSKCIRCLKCVTVCPNNALDFKLRLPMRIYLRKKQINKTIIYI